MELLTLLHEARAAGLQLKIQSGGLSIRGPKSAGKLAKALGERKAEVVSILEVVSALTGSTSRKEPDPSREVLRPADSAVDPDEQCRENFEERAAIMEYDGGLPRPEAERLARLAAYGDNVPVGLSALPEYPWRDELPRWPDDWRECWGRRANQLAEAGVPWPEDERQAFAEVAAEREARADLPSLIDAQGIEADAPEVEPERSHQAVGFSDRKDLLSEPPSIPSPDRPPPGRSSPSRPEAESA